MTKCTLASPDPQVLCGCLWTTGLFFGNYSKSEASFVSAPNQRPWSLGPGPPSSYLALPSVGPSGKTLAFMYCHSNWCTLM
ncbi:unnamed protein product [Protopolystoma xenopodis]|uniref:Uncharacterized protein n=1 Tax=Protopolystoma xenopodis TaxID=117903 RepID=A0A448XPB6_9PLAT|nr:unnamed protein product [Protopolystoma xenopodis]